MIEKGDRATGNWPRLAASMLLAVVLAPVAQSAELPPGEMARQIDVSIDSRLQATKTPASPVAEDAEFIRRATLDLHGVVPTGDRVVAFLNNTDPQKRAKLIDELLASPQYGRNFGMIWFNRIAPRSARANSLVDQVLQTWLAEQFNQGRGWNNIVSDILMSTGERDENPGTVFYLACQGNNRDGQPQPERVAASVSRLFLGLRLECCQCHNHPFNDLKQTDFWGLAAFFTNVRTELVTRDNKRPTQSAAIREGVEVPNLVKKGSFLPVSLTAQIEIPETGGKIARAKFLGGAEFATPAEPRFRPALASWVVADANPMFARAAVNRMWAHFFGQGLVEPVDDMRPENDCSHPEVLDQLTQQFISSGFELKHLIRSITQTAAYQRTSAPPEGRKSEPQLYGHMAARVMTADQLYDSLAQILQHTVGEHIANGGQKRKYGDARERFRIYFQAGGDDGNTPVPDYSHGIPQVLRIMNSPTLTDGSLLISRLNTRLATPEKVIEGLYLATLSRRPTADELARTKEFVAGESDRAQAYEDLLWVLLNSGEFLHNH